MSSEARHLSSARQARFLATLGMTASEDSGLSDRLLEIPRGVYPERGEGLGMTLVVGLGVTSPDYRLLHRAKLRQRHFRRDIVKVNFNWEIEAQVVGAQPQPADPLRAISP